MNMCFCNFTDRYDVPTAVLVVHGDTHTEQCREPVEVIGCEGLEEIPRCLSPGQAMGRGQRPRMKVFDKLKRKRCIGNQSTEHKVLYKVNISINRCFVYVIT